MTHTARKRKREEKRRKIGLSSRPKIDDNDDPEIKESKPKYKQEEINLENSETKNVFFLTLLAADKAFSASMASVSKSSRFLCLLFQCCEAAGHGVLWLLGSLYLLWARKHQKLHQYSKLDLISFMGYYST